MIWKYITYRFLHESFLMFYIYQYLYQQNSPDIFYPLVYQLFFVVVQDLFVLPILQIKQIILSLSLNNSSAEVA
jgi:hypothetical protein